VVLQETMLIAGQGLSANALMLDLVRAGGGKAGFDDIARAEFLSSALVGVARLDLGGGKVDLGALSVDITRFATELWGSVVEERRLAEDGVAYTRAEFVEHYGGLVEWGAAPREEEEKEGEEEEGDLRAAEGGVEVEVEVEAEAEATTEAAIETDAAHAAASAPAAATPAAAAADAAGEEDGSETGPWWYYNVSPKTIGVRREPRIKALGTGMGVRSRTCHQVSEHTCTFLLLLLSLSLSFFVERLTNSYFHFTYATYGCIILYIIRSHAASL